MILDIDYFKKINDTYGHSSGDKALKLFSQVVQDSLKYENYAIGRWGGKEFVVIVYDKNESQTYEIAERIRRNVAEAAENRRALHSPPLLLWLLFYKLIYSISYLFVRSQVINHAIAVQRL